MTNEPIIPLSDIDLDATRPIADFERIIDHLDALNLIPNSIDHFSDDAHADPESYLPSSTTFCALNHFTPADDDFYARFNAADCDMIISYRMILESINDEIMIALNETKNAFILISNYLTTQK